MLVIVLMAPLKFAFYFPHWILGDSSNLVFLFAKYCEILLPTSHSSLEIRIVDKFKCGAQSNAAQSTHSFSNVLLLRIVIAAAAAESLCLYCDVKVV